MSTLHAPHSTPHEGAPHEEALHEDAPREETLYSRAAPPARGTLVGNLLRSRLASALCLAVVLLALYLPPGGLGVPLCHFKEVSGLPCLGCGLTRSFIALAHLNVSRAAAYHPLALIVFPLVVLLAGLVVAPRRFRERLGQWADTRRRTVTVAGGALLAFFLLYGVGRLALCAWWMSQSQRFPVDW